MRTPLIQCISCDDPANTRAFPYCTQCLDALVPAFTGFPTEKRERYPWNENESSSDDHGTSDIALFLSIAHSHQVLSSWKKHARPPNTDLLIRTALERSPLRSLLMREAPDCIVPISQSLRRIFQLGTQPSALFASRLKRQLGLRAPILHLLESRSNRRDSLMQKQKNQLERLQTQTRFEIAETYREAQNRYRKIWIVDDFRTTGTTLSNAKETLRTIAPQARMIGVTLGYRPTLHEGSETRSISKPLSA